MNRLGLRAKLIASNVVLVVVFAGFFGIYFPREQEQMADHVLRARVHDIAVSLQAFGIVLAGQQDFEQKATLEHFARQKNADSDIAYVVFALPNAGTSAGKPPIGYNPASIPAELRGYIFAGETAIVDNDDYVQVSIPVIRTDDTVVGTITVGLTRSSVHEARERGRNVALLVSVVIMVVGIGLSWLVGIGIATPLLAAARELDLVSGNMVSAAREQEAAAAQEAAAVAETRRSMETLLDSAQQIADRSSEVLGNAERSTSGSRQIAGRIGDLNELAENVAELLRVIVQVADKADLLALNASLEGTRAGAAGKGFALVAAEMRRLAESVVESVSGIRELMKDMRDASQAAVTASQEGTSSSTATTHSAREIALLTQEQRQATEQVMASMDEMGDILNHTLQGIQQTTGSADRLTELATKLARMVHPTAMRRGGSDDPSTLSRGGSIERTQDESRF